MYPILFDVGGVEITSFGALVAVAGIVGLLVFRGELRRSRLPDQGIDAAIAGILGGLAGAKLLWVLEHLSTGEWTDLLFSRGGLSWFGGFAGGVAAALIVMRRHRLPAACVFFPGAGGNSASTAIAPPSQRKNLGHSTAPERRTWPAPCLHPA